MSGCEPEIFQRVGTRRALRRVMLRLHSICLGVVRPGRRYRARVCFFLYRSASKIVTPKPDGEREASHDVPEKRRTVALIVQIVIFDAFYASHMIAGSWSNGRYRNSPVRCKDGSVAHLRASTLNILNQPHSSGGGNIVGKYA